MKHNFSRNRIYIRLFFVLFRSFLEATVCFFCWQKFFGSDLLSPFFEGAVFFLIFAFFHTKTFLQKFFLDPLKSICVADENSHISSSKIKKVQSSSILFDDLRAIVSFRNAVVDLLEKKEKKVEYSKPLQACYIERENLLDGVIEALTQANIYNDNDTGNHMERLGLYAAFLAKKKGLDEKFVSEIARYAPLHDVGKIGIPDSILKKEGRLNREEWIVMKTHSQIGYDILKSVGMSEIAQNIALYHHENWMGGGYPEGLKGEDIPIEARLVSIADVFDALINKRVYKEAFAREKVEKIMLNEVGKKFDPNLGRIAYDHLDDLYRIFEDNKRAEESS